MKFEFAGLTYVVTYHEYRIARPGPDIISGVGFWMASPQRRIRPS
jgi:hypothetical protein